MLTQIQIPNDLDLKEAISLKCAMCYGALSFANAIGGFLTKPWELCHTYSLKDLLLEAEERKIDLSDTKSAIDGKPIRDTLYYKKAKGLISDEEYKNRIKEWKNGG